MEAIWRCAAVCLSQTWSDLSKWSDEQCIRSLQMLIGWFVLEEELPSVPSDKSGSVAHRIYPRLGQIADEVLHQQSSLLGVFDIPEFRWVLEMISSDLGLLDLMPISETSLQLVCGILNWGSAKLVNSKLLPKGGRSVCFYFQEKEVRWRRKIRLHRMTSSLRLSELLRDNLHSQSSCNHTSQVKQNQEKKTNLWTIRTHQLSSWKR